jgi:DNA-binding HxlR family transcriptional regulator
MQAILREVLGRVWYAPILRTLEQGSARYSAIQSGVGDATGKWLTDSYLSIQLRGLRELGLVERRKLEARHPTWALTGLGRDALDVVQEMDFPADQRRVA